ncbi:MAG: electron transport complex subunit RsxC [Bacteroides sp.]|nr:electron transport complex subunit RsxC [Bacteroides sp.]
MKLFSSLLTFPKGGIHPPQHKLTAGFRISPAPLPMRVRLLVSQHIGAPARIVVAKGQRVDRGSLVAEASGFVSAPVHSPISGTVTDLSPVRTSSGSMADCITVTASEADHQADIESPLYLNPIRTDEEIDALSQDDIRRMAASAGLVGMGGAAFPSHVKLSPPAGAAIDCLIVNGAECEPYLTCDHALMLAWPAEVVAGARLLMKAAGAPRCVIAIEANKPDAISVVSQAALLFPEVEVVSLRVKYPQGGEKQLVRAVTGREVPSGALPSSVGVVIQNVATARALWRAVAHGEPLIERVVTVTGPSMARPGNYLVAIGDSLESVASLAGGIPDDTGKIVLGGPMMGRSAEVLDAPVVKGLSGLLAIPESQAVRPPVKPCIRCAACVGACPMGLQPYLLANLAARRMFDDAASEGAADCIECGSCSYICPAARPLADWIRVGKRAVIAAARRRN